jgi:hypothetical protein
VLPYALAEIGQLVRAPQRVLIPDLIGCVTTSTR